MACFHRPVSSLVPRLSTSLVEMKSANMNKFHGKKQHNIFNCTVVLSSWCYTLNIVNFLNDRKEVPEREGLGTTAFLSSLELSQVETIFFPPDSWNQLDRHDEPFGLPGLQVSFHRKPPNSVITSTCCCCKALSSHHISSPSSSLSEGTIVDIIASLMVLPNRMCVPLVDQVKVDQMRFPLPRVCEISLTFNVLIFISSPAQSFSFNVRKYCEFKSFWNVFFMLIICSFS